MKKISSVLAVLCLSALISLDASAKKKPQPLPSSGDAPLTQSPLAPPCLDADNNAIPYANNEEVLQWKEETPNQYHDRALVIGKLVGVIQERKSHLHLEIDIGTAGKPTARDEHIEIVYNKSFGPVDDLPVGAIVEACGDYITSNKKAGNYEPSPVGAIIHWVHASNDTNKHSDGFLVIDGQVYGQEIPKNGRGNQNNFWQSLPFAAGF